MAETANNTTIPTATQLVDANNNIWTVVAGVINQNGVAQTITHAVVLLLYYRGVIYQENSAGNWWLWNGINWIATKDPRPVANSNTSNSNTSSTLIMSSFNTTALANQISFTITTNTAITANSYVQAYRNGLAEVLGLHYTVSGNVVTFASPSRKGDLVYFVWNH